MVDEALHLQLQAVRGQIEAILAERPLDDFDVPQRYHTLVWREAELIAKIRDSDEALDRTDRQEYRWSGSQP